MPDIVSFVRKWNASSLTERSAAPQHFRDLCEALGVPHPTEEDVDGTNYTYEKHVTKTGTTEKGYADVWKRGWFAWEYKSKGGDLNKAYKQLNEYHEALENPPLLVCCDFVRFVVHTKFENTPPRTYAFTLDDLLHDRDTATSALPPIEVLRHVFGDFNQLRPGIASARVTEAAASDFLRLAKELERERASDRERPSKEQIAHFLMRLVFCLFADSVGLLPNHAFRRLVTNDRHSPLSFNRKLPVLFEAMSKEHGFFGADNIPYFNGGLFSDNATIELNHADLGILFSASQHDWSHIEPAIFGTLFERSLDAAKRSMIGAHYTSTEDILLLVEPVVMQPLRRRWEAVQASVLAALAEESEPDTNPDTLISQRGTDDALGSRRGADGELISRRGTDDALGSRRGADGELISRRGTASAVPLEPRTHGASAPGVRLANARQTKRQPTLSLNRPALTILQDWAAELSSVRILDPACGSGNFLYVALKRLLDLWHEARIFAIKHELSLALDPMPNPAQLYGIEIDFYAHEIASVVVWIGFLQWKHDHGIKDDHSPLLQKLNNIQENDAIMRVGDDNLPCEPEWPETDYIIGNPPFLGDKMMRGEMGDEYVTNLRKLYEGRVPGGADLVTYWFEKARAQIEAGHAQRAGLIATNSIRMVGNRPVLERIKQSGDIFMAWSDNPWVNEGAAVRISIVGFEGPTATHSKGGSNVGEVSALSANGATISQPGAQPQGRVSTETQRAEGPTYWLDGQPVPSINADLTSGANLAGAIHLRENENLCFLGVMKGGPFDISNEEAKKMLSRPSNPNGRPNSDVVKRRLGGQDITGRDRGGWLIDFGTMTESDAALYEWPFEFVKTHVKPLRDVNRDALMHRDWWLHGRSRPALRAAIANLSRCIVTPEVAKHRLFVWMDTLVVPDHKLHVFAREDDYFFGVLHSRAHEVWTIATCSWMGKGNDPSYNSSTTFETFPLPYPPGTEPSESDSPIVRAISDAARELVRLRDVWINPEPVDGKPIPEAELKKRTLTNLYNERPTWLANAHRTLDEAVFAAYGWPLGMNGKALSDQDILSRLLALNHERAAAQIGKS